MKSDKIVIYPNVLNFMNIGAVFMGTASLFLFFVSLTGIKFYDDERYPGIALLCLIMGILFLGSPLGKKITISGNIVEYRNWFFFNSKIQVTEETKIKMGCCYPKWGGHPDFIWKISNNRGKEKIKINASCFNYKRVNAEFEKLAGYKIDYSLAEIKF